MESARKKVATLGDETTTTTDDLINFSHQAQSLPIGWGKTTRAYL